MFSLPGFIQTYFFDPITQYSGYNIVNTAVYAVILIAVSFFLIYPFFNKRGIKFDWNFFKAVFPFILFGSSLRIIEDLEILGRSANPFAFGYYLVSPGIYILIGLFTIAALVASIKAAGYLKMEKLKLFSLIGWVFAVPTLAFVLIFVKNFIGLGMVLGLIALSFVIAKFSVKKLMSERLNLATFTAQIADGSATFIAIQFFGYGEQHVASNTIISGLGPVWFFIAKFILVIVIIFAIQRYMNKAEESNLKCFILLFITILGLAPGIRDALRLAVMS